MARFLLGPPAPRGIPSYLRNRPGVNCRFWAGKITPLWSPFMKSFFQRFFHASLGFLIDIPLFIAYLSVMLVYWLSVLADKTWPEADRGNCWMFSFAKWHREGRYLAVRPVPGAKMLGTGFVPHIFWVKDLQGCELQMTQPLYRYNGLLLILHCWYFRYVLRNTENPRYGDWRSAPKRETAFGPLGE